MNNIGNKSRRDFIKNIGLFSGASLAASQLPPIEKLIEIVSNNIIQKAAAGEENEKFYLLSYLPGAPARFVFDHFLVTKANQSVDFTPNTGTRLVATGASGNYDSVSNETFEYRGLKVPYLWSSKVAAPGGTRPMSDLLDNLLAIRGYGTGVDGHVTNCARQSRPVNSIGSTAGLLSEQSKTLLKASQYAALGDFSGYYSPNGVGLTKVLDQATDAKAKLLNSLMYPFAKRDDAANVTKLRRSYSKQFDRISNIIKSQMTSESGRLIAADYDGAMKKIMDGIESLEAEWTGLYTKYEDIIMRTMRDQSTVGLNDKPVVNPSDSATAESVASEDPIFNVMGTGNITGSISLPGYDMRNWFNTATLIGLIQSFALAEFVFKNKLCSSMEIGRYYMYNLNGMFLRPRNVVTPYAAGSQSITFYFEHDHHTMGAVPMVLLCGTFFRCYAAACLELTSQLKKVPHAGGTLFDAFAIHTVSDFNRACRPSGGGGDHGFDAMVTSIISGMVRNGPMVVGNVSRQPAPNLMTSYQGTWGHKGITKLNGNELMLTPAHITSGLASILSFQHNPWKNIADPLFEISSGGIILNTGAEIV